MTSDPTSVALAVAAVAACASVIVAIISLITAIISGFQSARSNKAVEALKYDLSRMTARETIRDAQLVEALKALQQAIHAIQQVKDEMQLIVSAVGTSLDAKTALERIVQAREALFACYEEQLAHLDDAEARTLHRAKNNALGVENLLRERLEHSANASDLTAEDRQQLMVLRGYLTDAQQLLRDSRLDRLTKVEVNAQSKR